ncbi:transglycosylase domain-containing protein [Myxococcota bacterium]|nr:transglycosylase domain-containing protein [Myxococcota bacterium]
MKPSLAVALRWTRRLLLGTLALGVVGAVAAAVFYKRHVLDEPGAHIGRDAIMEIIAQESPVLYADGQSRIGVFFSQEHRDYVPYARIPQAWVDAIVAAEDQRFFQHRGLDWKGIGRAMRDNVKAGGVVAGGSSLTQQTAKNLYYRPDRSLRSKWEELVNALRLEAHHSKEDILEFYANQFHVSANGRGLGIAARYFFDKEVEELSTLECAFLAGMVKAPATYNPFLGQSEERQAAARQRAKARTRYVLDRMLATGAIDAAEHAALIAQEIPFKRGTFRYDTHVILDEVAARLEQAPFPELFAELGIDNPSTAGIQVVTTIDRTTQEGATWALWHRLTEVGPLLEGGEAGWQGAAAFALPTSRAPGHDPHDPPARWEFRTALVRAAAGGADPSMLLDLGGHDCVVDGDGVRRAATVVARARKGEAWQQAGVAEVDALVQALGPGTVVWASVAAPASLNAPARCDLELRPALQGAVIVLEDGRIRAMVGGNDNRNFNRAVTAKRQLGSTWKPVLYYAALQLGWTPVDVLDNRPDQAFRFEGSWYYPRPDHDSEDFVSLAWAGTRSENLASIWLMAHLVDRLDAEELRALAELTGLAPARGEAREAWVARIRDEWGVISTPDRLPEVAFAAGKAELLDELRTEGQEEQVRELWSLPYGTGAEAEAARQRGNAGRQRALRFHFQRLEALGERCAAEARLLQGALDGGPTPRPAQIQDLRLRPAAGRMELGCGEVGEGWATVGEHLLAAVAEGVQLPLGEVSAMQVDGRLRLDTLQRLRRAMSRQELVLRQADPWSLDVLVHHPDYRQLLAMRYLALLARRLGVQQDLPPVLSIPLGAVDISVEEAALLYQAMLRGQAWSFPGQASLPGVAGATRTEPIGPTAAPTLLISEIRDRHGAVLYRAAPDAATLTEPVPGALVGDILRNVVRWGTGRRADGAVTLAGRPVPVAGKTGTTNSYRNAAFVGFVPRAAPGPEGPRWTWGDGFTIAAYVGYDDNRPMRRGGVRLQGASGALPAWIGTAQALSEAGLLGTAPPASDEWTLQEGLAHLPVGAGAGLPVDDPALAEGRGVLVAHERGLFGVKDSLWRVVSPVRPAAEGAGGLPPGEPATVEGATALPAEPGAEVPGEGGALLPPAEGAGSAPAMVPTEAPTEGAGPDGAAPPEMEPPSTEPDAVRQWLGDLLDAPAPEAPVEGAPEPTAGAGAGASPPTPTAEDTGAIVPRIGPSTSGTDPR